MYIIQRNTEKLQRERYYNDQKVPEWPISHEQEYVTLDIYTLKLKVQRL